MKKTVLVLALLLPTIAAAAVVATYTGGVVINATSGDTALSVTGTAGKNTADFFGGNAGAFSIDENGHLVWTYAQARMFTAYNGNWSFYLQNLVPGGHTDLGVFSPDGSVDEVMHVENAGTNSMFAIDGTIDFIAGSGESMSIELDGSNVTLGLPLKLSNAYASGNPTTTGYLLIKDNTGTVYEIPAKVH